MAGTMPAFDEELLKLVVCPRDRQDLRQELLSMQAPALAYLADRLYLSASK
jgi:uncharacterized protein YbaR (Trm112 family)